MLHFHEVKEGLVVHFFRANERIVISLSHFHEVKEGLVVHQVPDFHMCTY